MNTDRSTEFAKIFIVSLVFLMLITQVVPSGYVVHALDGKDVEGYQAPEERMGTGRPIQSSTAAGTPYLVKDIFQGSGYWLSEFTIVDNVLFFIAYKPMGPNSIYELWKSDGTESGTVMVKQFIALSAFGGSVGKLSDINGTLFFAASDENHGEELWKSDGTETGTVMVKDINPGKDSSYIDELTNVNGIAFFRAIDGSHSDELWKSDGTEPGTMMVNDINGSGGSWPRYFTPIDGTVYFSANDGSTGHELWKSDGTESGTEQVLDIRPGSSSSEPNDLINFNGLLYFSAHESFCKELWKSDGTNVGTVSVEDSFTLPDACEPEKLTIANGVLYFRADGYDFELWKSDGTDAGTVQVKEINPTFDGSNPEYLTAVGDQIYFTADDGSHGIEMWKSDGTDAGTVLVKDINVGAGDSSPEQLTSVGSSLFFSSYDGSHGRELWKSDGSGSGTVLVKDIGISQVSCCRIGPIELIVLAGSLFFTYSDEYQHGELWVSDSTEAGTEVLKEIHPNSGGSNIRSTADAAGSLFFFANDGMHGKELWMSDGSLSGTKLIEGTDPYPDKRLDELEGVGNLAFFRAEDGIHGAELWKSDGTVSGTKIVKDIKPGSGESYPENLINVNGRLFFLAQEEGYNDDLWKSDGTETGTVLVKDIWGIDESIAVGSKLYFTYSGELWVSDGTDPGTNMVKNIHAFCMTDVNGHLYFVGEDSTYGRELWKSDGTEAGTVMVKDINPGIGMAMMDADLGTCEFAVLGDELYFFADDGIHGHELWKSDGIESGTMLVKDIHPGAFESCYWGNYCSLTGVGDELFFVAKDEVDVLQLWKSDGTESGSVVVTDIGYFSYSTNTPLYDIFGTLYFVTDDGIHGYELWTSDGSEAGTMIVQDIAPEILSSTPRQFRVSGSHLFFEADDLIHGRELWAMWIGSLGSLSISGDQTGYTGIQYDFSAQANPADAATPVTYEWQATGQVSETNVGGLIDTASFTWSTPGVKTITVTASNGVNSVSAEWSITISMPDVPLASVNLTGAVEGQTGATYDFLAEVSPSNATTPITYEWQATGQSSETNTGGDSDTVSFTWDSVGEKTVSVTASNAVNSVEAELTIVIGEEDIALEALTLSGDEEGLIGDECEFTADISPLGATTPVTFVWQATGQADVTHSSGVTDSVVFVWDTPGMKTISVTAYNSVNQLTKQVQIEIDYLKIHLPIIMNK